jgi:hypothetical protein
MGYGCKIFIMGFVLPGGPTVDVREPSSCGETAAEIALAGNFITSPFRS